MQSKDALMSDDIGDSQKFTYLLPSKFIVPALDLQTLKHHSPINPGPCTLVQIFLNALMCIVGTIFSLTKMLFNIG